MTVIITEAIRNLQVAWQSQSKLPLSTGERFINFVAGDVFVFIILCGFQRSFAKRSSRKVCRSLLVLSTNLRLCATPKKVTPSLLLRSARVRDRLCANPRLISSSFIDPRWQAERFQRVVTRPTSVHNAKGMPTFEDVRSILKWFCDPSHELWFGLIVAILCSGLALFGLFRLHRTTRTISPLGSSGAGYAN